MARLNNKYWINIVDMVATASTCRVKIGCVLVYQNKIVGTGFVGSVPGDKHCEDSECLFVDNYGVQGSSNSGRSCCRTLHAEMNAVLQCNIRISNGEYIYGYMSYQPCLLCLKLMLSIGVRHIVYKIPYKDLNRDFYLDNLSDAVSNSLIMYKYFEG